MPRPKRSWLASHPVARRQARRPCRGRVGTNDAAIPNSVERYRSNYRTLLGTIAALTPRAAILAIPQPEAGFEEAKKVSAALIDSYNAILPELAKKLAHCSFLCLPCRNVIRSTASIGTRPDMRSGTEPSCGNRVRRLQVFLKPALAWSGRKGSGRSPAELPRSVEPATIADVSHQHQNDFIDGTHERAAE